MQVTTQSGSHHNKVSPDIIQLEHNWNICKRKERIGWMSGSGVVAGWSDVVEMN